MNQCPISNKMLKILCMHSFNKYFFALHYVPVCVVDVGQKIRASLQTALGSNTDRTQCKPWAHGSEHSQELSFKQFSSNMIV